MFLGSYPDHEIMGLLVKVVPVGVGGGAKFWGCLAPIIANLSRLPGGEPASGVFLPPLSAAPLPRSTLYGGLGRSGFSKRPERFRFRKKLIGYNLQDKHAARQAQLHPTNPS